MSCTNAALRDVWFNVISVMMGMGGGGSDFQKKNNYITLEWPQR